MSFLLRQRLPSILSRPSSSILTRSFSATPSSNLARLTIIGRLGADAEVQTTSSGQTIVKYAVGTSYGPKDNRQTSWFRVASFPAEGTAQKDLMANLEKGTLVYVEGDASIRTYEDADGKKQSALSVVQRNIEVLRRPYKEDTSQEPAAAHA